MMWFNIISILGFIISMGVIKVSLQSKHGLRFIKILSVFLLTLKTVEYIYLNYSGEFSYPVEISTISYFLFSTVVLFRQKKWYHVASFFAIISGIGFFAYYSILGFVSSFYFGLFRHIIAVICHGILLIGGVYLYRTNRFSSKQRFHLVIVMLLIIAHASIFYLDSIQGTTFIYFLIRPDFLEITVFPWLNHLVQVIYYFTLMFVFQLLITSFYKYNEVFIYQTKSALLYSAE